MREGRKSAAQRSRHATAPAAAVRRRAAHATAPLVTRVVAHLGASAQAGAIEEEAKGG